MRTDRSIIYHIYPLGFCAVEPRNGFASEPVNRISKISGWLPHIQSLGCDTLLLGPVWESSAHGCRHEFGAGRSVQPCRT